MLYIEVYVDDIVRAGKTEEQVQEVKNNLSQQFDIRDLGKLWFKFFLE